MKLPTICDVNEVAQLMYGMNFNELPREDRLGVATIAQQSVLTAVIDDLPVQLGIQFAECLVEYGPKWKEHIDALVEIDKSLGPIMEWFEKSRLYEP